MGEGEQASELIERFEAPNKDVVEAGEEGGEDMQRDTVCTQTNPDTHSIHSTLASTGTPGPASHRPRAGLLTRVQLRLCWQVYNTTPSTDKYARLGKVERAEGTLQSILKFRKVDGG